MQLNQFCGAGILGREAAKRASGQSTFLKVSLLTDDPMAVTTGSRGDVFVVRTSKNPSKTSEKMGYFDRVTVSLHIL